MMTPAQIEAHFGFYFEVVPYADRDSVCITVRYNNFEIKEDMDGRIHRHSPDAVTMKILELYRSVYVANEIARRMTK